MKQLINPLAEWISIGSIDKWRDDKPMPLAKQKRRRKPINNDNQVDKRDWMCSIPIRVNKQKNRSDTDVNFKLINHCGGVAHFGRRRWACQPTKWRCWFKCLCRNYEKSLCIQKFELEPYFLSVSKKFAQVLCMGDFTKRRARKV